MARVTTYLNFPRQTEEAFLFYKSVFKTEFVTPLMRFSDGPPSSEEPRSLSASDAKLIMHVALPTIGGHVLMGSDAPESLGFKVNIGNNVFINLEPDTRKETDQLFKALSEGGKVDMPLQEMFWGAYFGTLTDKFGVQWMFNCASKS
jgi:PhnB protein